KPALLGIVQADAVSLSAPRRATVDRAVPGLAWRPNGEADPRQEAAHRALERAEAGHHTPRRDSGARPERKTQTLQHPLAWSRARTVGGEAAEGDSKD